MNTGSIALWYTGCYISEEDACLLDKMNDNFGEQSDTDVFPDKRAITIKNIQVPRHKMIPLTIVFSIVRGIISRGTCSGQSSVESYLAFNYSRK